jgi:hypothetical protein
MNWETIIPRSTINICPTMTPIEEPRKYRKGLEHIDERRASHPPHDAMTAVGGKGERSGGIAGEENKKRRLVALSAVRN